MKVAVAGVPHSRWDKMQWVAEGFSEAGHQVKRIVKYDHLAEADAWADLVILGHKAAGFNITDLIATAEKRKAFWVQWWFDLLCTDRTKPLTNQPQYESYAGVMKAVDLVLVKERPILPLLEEAGIRAEYVDQGCPAWLAPCQHLAKPAYDVALWGTFSGYYRYRKDCVKALTQAGYKVAWAGSCGTGGSAPPGVEVSPKIEVKDLPAFASQARFVLSVDGRHDIDGYCSDRLWLALGMGACVLRPETPGFGLVPGFAFSEPAELVALIAGVDPATELHYQTAMGSMARDFVMRQHTYKHRAERIMDLCNAV